MTRNVVVSKSLTVLRSKRLSLQTDVVYFLNLLVAFHSLSLKNITAAFLMKSVIYPSEKARKSTT